MMESANRASSFERDRCPNEATGLSRLRRIDRLCHRAEEAIHPIIQSLHRKGRPTNSETGTELNQFRSPSFLQPSFRIKRLSSVQCWPGAQRLS